MSDYYNLTRPEYSRLIEKARENKDLTCFIDYALLGYRDGLEQTLNIIQGSQFENTWQKLIYDQFDAIWAEMREEVFKRQRQLALEFPFEKGLMMSEISVLYVHLAKTYAKVSEKTIQWDIEKLIELKRVKKANDKFFANIDILKSMIAKKKWIIWFRRVCWSLTLLSDSAFIHLPLNCYFHNKQLILKFYISDNLSNVDNLVM